MALIQPVVFEAEDRGGTYGTHLTRTTRMSAMSKVDYENTLPPMFRAETSKKRVDPRASRTDRAQFHYLPMTVTLLARPPNAKTYRPCDFTKGLILPQ